VLEDSLIQALPELVAFVRRDGVVLRELGGRRLGLPANGQLTGKSISEVWPAEISSLLLQMIRRVLRDRSACDLQFVHEGRRYEARVAAQGRERALCVIRDLPELAVTDAHAVANEGVRGAGRSALERRSFHARFSESLAEAQLREQPLALCMLHLHGLGALGRVLDFGVVEKLLAALIARLPQVKDAGRWYIGQLTDNLIAAVIEDFPDQEALRQVALRLCESLSQPVALGDAAFTVTPSAGIATLGIDATQASVLLEHARSAMHEARRDGKGSVQFYSEALRLSSLARLDVEHELRSAIAGGQLALRYAARHELKTGKLLAVQSYLHWPHPLRGEVAAAEFLPIADTTGLSVPLSRWALQRWQLDLPALRAAGAPGMKFSFGPLRQHLACGLLAVDLADLLQSGVVAAHEIEVRIAEQALAGLANPAAVLKSLAALGVTLVIDEFGRGATSLLRLARLPVYGLQIERSLAAAAVADPMARKTTMALLAIAAAYGVRAIASGVDTPATRQLLADLGCEEGLGDCFGFLAASAALPGVRTARSR
jgi:predicted signal transduction protein with EAL and GGDEF domain